MNIFKKNQCIGSYIGGIFLMLTFIPWNLKGAIALVLLTFIWSIFVVQHKINFVKWSNEINIHMINKSQVLTDLIIIAIACLCSQNILVNLKISHTFSGIIRNFGLLQNTVWIFIFCFVAICIGCCLIVITKATEQRTGYREFPHIEWFYNISLIIFIINCVSNIYFSLNDYLSIDTSFSMGMIKHSYPEIVKLTAMDVHPPVYYFMLKMYNEILRYIIPSLNNIISSKLFSIIPITILGLITITFIKNKFGKFVSSCILLIISGLPMILVQSIEIRMYSWGMLFVSLSYIASYYILKNNKPVYVLYLVIGTTFAIYTHYYAAVAVGFFWIFLIYKTIKQRNIKLIIMLIIGLIITGICYLPWIFVIVNQLLQRKSDYWIESITFETIFAYLRDSLGPAIILLPLIPRLTLSENTRKDSIDNEFATMGIFALLFVLTFGISISILIRPFFISRYQVPCLFAFWLGFIVLIQKSQNKTADIILGMSICIIFTTGWVSNFKQQIQISKDMREFEKISSQINYSSDLIITDSNNCARILSIIYDDKVLDISHHQSKLSDELFNGMYPNVEITDLENIDMPSKTIYFYTDGNLETNRYFKGNTNKSYNLIWEGLIGENIKVYKIIL